MKLKMVDISLCGSLRGVARFLVNYVTPDIIVLLIWQNNLPPVYAPHLLVRTDTLYRSCLSMQGIGRIYHCRDIGKIPHNRLI